MHNLLQVLSNSLTANIISNPVPAWHMSMLSHAIKRILQDEMSKFSPQNSCATLDTHQKTTSCGTSWQTAKLNLHHCVFKSFFCIVVSVRSFNNFPITRKRIGIAGLATAILSKSGAINSHGVFLRCHCTHTSRKGWILVALTLDRDQPRRILFFQRRSIQKPIKPPFTTSEPNRIPAQEPARTRAHPPRPEVMQAQRCVPLAASIRIAIVDRRGTEHRARSVQDRRLTVGRVGVALTDCARRIGYRRY